MWTYNKALEYPINIKNPNPKLAKFIISQYGGPDGELAASLRYLSQRFGMPDQKAKAILNDIGTEEYVPQEDAQRGNLLILSLGDQLMEHVYMKSLIGRL
ncbi:MAG: manganese catalase family protein [Clostridia bacterium]|nr:manganese catalase family protein [Clostridia bacterium]